MSLGFLNSIGMPELLIILFVALLMFGGRLPEVARSLGKSVNQFKRGLKDIEDEMNAPETPAAQKSLPPPASTPTPPPVQQTASTAANESTKQPQS